MQHRLFVDIAAVLDTRLAAISILDEKAATRMLNDERYYTRLTDEFWLIDPAIDEQKYKELIHSGDVELLVSSRPTGMLIDISKTVQILEKKIMTGQPDISSLGIDINIYPFKLTPDELHDMKEAFSKYWGVMTEINFVEIPYKDLTTELISSMNWSVLYLYNFFKWEESYLPFLKEKPKPIPSVTLCVPDLVRSMAILEAMEKEKPKVGASLTHREIAAIYFSDIIGITHQDISNWCILRV